MCLYSLTACVLYDSACCTAGTGLCSLWISMWAAAKTNIFALRSQLHPHPPTSQPSVPLMARRHFGRLGLEPLMGTGAETAGFASPRSLLVPPPSLSRSLLQFPRCLSYLCHGNCARLPAHTHILPHLSPFASSMTQQLLQGAPVPPPPHLTDTKCSSDRMAFCSKVIKHLWGCFITFIIFCWKQFKSQLDTKIRTMLLRSASMLMNILHVCSEPALKAWWRNNTKYLVASQFCYWGWTGSDRLFQLLKPVGIRTVSIPHCCPQLSAVFNHLI